MPSLPKLQALAQKLTGDLYFDLKMRTLYATDASAYRELPLAVAIPQNIADLQTLIAFAKAEKTSLIPRTAGTSLAGQVVGKGIVVDVSKHFNQILEVNEEEKWVRVQAGVVRDELNRFLESYGLFFAPETSTANRAMIGGMVGNNSCGSNSVMYGSTREHLLEVKCLLSDGKEVTFNTLNKQQLSEKKQGNALENAVYKGVCELLENKENRAQILKEFPKANIERRNTGYALDMLLQSLDNEQFNFCKLMAGSEGTLAFLTEIKLNLLPLPPKHKVLICPHFESIDAALRANLIALEYRPTACELIDHFVLDCTKVNLEHSQNRFFVKGDPQAILIIELARESLAEAQQDANTLVSALQHANLGYHFPLVTGADTKRVWALRKAGLGLLANLQGDEKAVAVIEDTAVAVEDLPAYIAEFNQILKRYNLYCVHYAHAGSGELHLRPILNLKTQDGHQLFRKIATEIAHLVKKYQGSLSGEHGDGRLRGEFIPLMLGKHNYQLLQEVKRIFDPSSIFNPQKIVETPPMDTALRYEAGQETPDFDTVFSFEKQQGILRAAELCNGSGDCRKSEKTGGTMCPSYMATRSEQDTTRARANILREMLTHSHKRNRFDHQEIKDVMDLCLSCKGCKSECPSNVDMATLKAEFLYQYQKTNGIPLTSLLMGHISKASAFALPFSKLHNKLTNSKLVKNLLGISQKRTLPSLQKQTLRNWWKKHQKNRLHKAQKTKGQLYFFCDEFSNFYDVEIGKKAVLLLEKLGYEVIMPPHLESGRTFISKGLLQEAKHIAKRNVEIFESLVSKEVPLVGLEPSAILTFRDEYIGLVPQNQRDSAKKLAESVLLFDEFFAQEVEKGNIQTEQFSKQEASILLHGHCHQKALSSVSFTQKMLETPENYQVEVIPSGCCGMAGSFGYEKAHYEVSMQVGELVLFPSIRKAEAQTKIAAVGTSCRHQIQDGTKKVAQHPVELLWEAIL